MRNILFVLQALPWPLEFGGKQAMFNGVAAVKDIANIYITYLQYNQDTDAKQRECFIKAMNGNVTVFPYIEKRDMSTPRKIVSKVTENLDRRFFKKDKDCFLDRQLKIRQPSQNEIMFINKIIEDNKIDTVQVEMLSHLALINTLPKSVRKIFVHHELGFVRKSQILHEVEANDYYYSIAESLKIQEIGLLNKYDDVVVLSNTDREKLIDAGVKVPVHTSLAIVKQPEVFNPQIDDYHTLFYIGPSKHKPNVFAIKWFLENCWENLLKKDKGFRLKVIGRWDKESIKSLLRKYDNLEFVGFVENLSDILKDGIMIVPITIGSGIRMKILEAAAYGVPVVSTTVGAEGLPIQDGKNGFLADTPDTFVDAILKLSDVNIRTEFVEDLNKTIREKYSFEALKVNRREILRIYES